MNPARELTWRGETRTAREWAERTGLTRGCIKQRLAAGWPVARVLATPPRPAGARFRDLTGTRFGRLVALRRVERPGHVPPSRDLRPSSERVFWALRCDCGQTSVACHRDLLSGGTRSCGCLQRETRQATARAMAAATNEARARRIRWRGEDLTVPELAERLGVSDATIYRRLAVGRPPDAAFTPAEKSASSSKSGRARMAKLTPSERRTLARRAALAGVARRALARTAPDDDGGDRA